MSEFVETVASKRSISNRKLVFGVGVNDVDYITQPVDHKTGKRLICPFYRRWRDMIRRCYSSQYHETRPTYKDCYVSEEWKYFNNFKAWMKKQDWVGMELDKDILVPGNKIYSPEYCLFIPQELNSLLTDSGSTRGNFPIGACFHKSEGKFHARCSVDGKNKYLGSFTTPEAASLAYRQFKSNLIIKTADQYPELKEALLVHADMYLRGEIL